jgi:hypothetical protein
MAVGSEIAKVHTEAATVRATIQTNEAQVPEMNQKATPMAHPIPKTISVGMAKEPPAVGRIHPRTPRAIAVTNRIAAVTTVGSCRGSSRASVTWGARTTTSQL